MNILGQKDYGNVPALTFLSRRIMLRLQQIVQGLGMVREGTKESEGTEAELEILLTVLYHELVTKSSRRTVGHDDDSD